MNDKFFQLPLEKQERIINAAYKVFAQNTYKKAPMSEIANEGNISKALLFHYFKNKKELYYFLWDKSIEQVKRASQEYGVLETTDFFEMIYRSLLAKCSVIRAYPWLYQFAVKAYYEQEPEIKQLIQKSFLDEDQSSEEIMWNYIDISNIRQDIDIRLLYREILLISDGYLRQMLLSGKLDADQMEKDFTRMIEQWKKLFCVK
jgi:AcrR family transcriptional regulator